jgi:hypothetical protein
MPRRVPNECIVCLEACTSLSSDLFLYNCTCVYAIHPECFKKWRSIGETSSICVICRESLLTFDEEGEQEQQQENIIIVPRYNVNCGTLYEGALKIYLFLIFFMFGYIIVQFYMSRPS